MNAARASSTRRRGRSAGGRRRAARAQIWQGAERARPLLQSVDHGEPILVDEQSIQGLPRDRWIEPFLAANASALDRLRLEPETRITRDGVRLALHPSERIGAVPLLSPATRKVVAGALISPRFGWTSVGSVLGEVGYRVEPAVGGGPLVPGSAREVPPWILAGPVLSRIGALLSHLARRFVLAREPRLSPRGRVDWTDYARRSLPTGHWERFPCTFPDLLEDPWLLSALRWTVRRLRTDLEPTADSPVSRRLLDKTHGILNRLGPGPEHRPASEDLRRTLGDPLLSDYLHAALEAMGWVRDERGLGGARTLDGLAWSLATDQLWEAWVESIFADLARRVGARLETAREGGTRRPLVWRTPLRTLGHLAPDLALHLPERTIWIDAKYKAHLIEIQRRGWSGVTDRLREAHRADLHQALAYAALGEASSADTWLVYPRTIQTSEAEADLAVFSAELSSRSRKLRLVLAGMPFGFQGPNRRDKIIASLEEALRTAG